MTISVTCCACGAEATATTGGTEALLALGWTEREPKGMLCPKCGGTRFCHVCGAVNDQGLCPSCGAYEYPAETKPPTGDGE